MKLALIKYPIGGGGSLSVLNSPTIIFDGSGTTIMPLIANVNISPVSGNILVALSSGLYASGVTSANEGLIVSGGVVQLGATYTGVPTSPAMLTNFRNIYLNGNNFLFTDNQEFAQGALVAPAILLNAWTVSNDGATSALLSTYGASSIAIANTYGADVQAYSFVQAQAGFFGYSGVQSSPYVSGQNGASHGKFANGYVSNFSGFAVWDGRLGAGNQLVGQIIGMFSGLGVQSGRATNGYDFYASELNSVATTTNPTPQVTNHYALYAEAFTLATNNFGIYINGSQTSYFGGNIGIGITTPTAWLQIGASTTGKTEIILTGGPLLTTPVNGAIEWDLTNLYITASGTRKTILSEIGVTASVTSAVTNKIQVNIGGTTYYILASTSNA